MQGKHKRYLLLFCLFLTITIVISVLYWLKPINSSSLVATNTTHPTSTNDLTTVPSSPSLLAPSTHSSSPSQQDTQINCQLMLDQSGQLIVNEQVKNCFEYFITQYGEKQITQIKSDFMQYIQTKYQEPARSTLGDLWSRYLDYRQALAELQAPTLAPERAAYYQQVYTDLQNLRKKHFSAYEIQGLFGAENTYHEYTLKRLLVLEDTTLNASEKAQQLKQLFENLPEDWQENLEQIATLDNLRKLTTELKARNASAQELRQMRMDLVGADATQRLENLDQQRNVWNNRVADYLTQRDQILKSGMSDPAKQAAVQALRNQQFTQPQELLRLQTFETAHDQGGKTTIE